MKEYTESLIDSLVAVFSENQHVSIEKKITDFTLSSKKTIPVGIIINELLTNAFKYAFQGRDKGHISIELDSLDNQVCLTIQDDGVGMDKKVGANKLMGFGLTIVKMLAEQLEGSFAIENENGTKSVLKFRI